MSSEIKVSSVKAKDGTAGISIADSTGNVSLSGSLSAGTIGDNVNTTNKYYLNLKVSSNTTLGSGGSYINTVGTTEPYFSYTGDSTNILPTDTNNIKIVRKGVYLVIFSATTYQHGDTRAAETVATIRGGTSVNPTSVISTAKDNIASADVYEVDYSNAVATYIAELPANYYLRFHIEGNYTNDITIETATHLSICLIRPTA